MCLSGWQQLADISRSQKAEQNEIVLYLDRIQAWISKSVAKPKSFFKKIFPEQGSCKEYSICCQKITNKPYSIWVEVEEDNFKWHHWNREGCYEHHSYYKQIKPCCRIVFTQFC